MANFAAVLISDAPLDAKNNDARLFKCKSSELQALLQGVGTLTADLAETNPIAATLTGLGSVTPTMAETFAMTTTLTGVGALTAFLEEVGAIYATLTGLGVLTPTMNQGWNIPAFLQGAGSLSAEMTLFHNTILATLRGQGFMSIPTLGGDFGMDATITGQGSVGPTLSGDFTMLALLQGTAHLNGYLKKSSDPAPITEVDTDVWAAF